MESIYDSLLFLSEWTEENTLFIPSPKGFKAFPDIQKLLMQPDFEEISKVLITTTAEDAHLFQSTEYVQIMTKLSNKRIAVVQNKNTDLPPITVEFIRHFSWPGLTQAGTNQGKGYALTIKWKENKEFRTLVVLILDVDWRVFEEYLEGDFSKVFEAAFIDNRETLRSQGFERMECIATTASVAETRRKDGYGLGLLFDCVLEQMESESESGSINDNEVVYYVGTPWFGEEDEEYQN